MLYRRRPSRRVCLRCLVLQEFFGCAMIARMNAAYKNHRGFLRAAAQLSRRLSNVEFLLVGDGPLRQELER